MSRLGLPDSVTACLFDLDGVITQTAKVHAAAWKETFDAFLKEREGDSFAQFTAADYDDHVDGKPREAGTRDFLQSRGMDADDELVNRISTQKNDLVVEKIA